jgi:hypothetical protein
MTSKSLRDLEMVISTVRDLVTSVNQQNEVIRKISFMCAQMHERVFPELYNQGQMLPVQYQEDNASSDQDDRPLVKLQ